MLRQAERPEGSGDGRRPRAGRLAVAALGLTLLSGFAAYALDELHFFRIGTAATTGTYFQIGGVLASAISKPSGSRDCARGGSCGVSGLVAIAQASQGSVQNVLAVGSGQIESALVQSDVASWAYKGAGATPKRCGARNDPALRPTGAALLTAQAPLKELRAIASLYAEDVHVVVRAEGSIQSLRDLKGKRVALGEPESGTLADARLVLEAVGLSDCEVKADYFRLSEAAAALIDDRIDAFFVVGGYPVPAITELAATRPIRLVAMPRDVADRLRRRFAMFDIDVIPAGTYPGLDSDTATVSTRALWVTRAELDEDLIHAITRSLWSDATQRLLAAAHPAGTRIRLATALDGLAIPLHPGAARFYREAGIKIPDGL